MPGSDAALIAAAIRDLADAQHATAKALRDLGTSNAATPMGAIEVLALETKHAAQEVRGGLDGIADALAVLAESRVATS